MVRFFQQSRAVRAALLVFLVIQVSGCMSREDQAQSQYERALKFIAGHDKAKAAIELRNAVRLKRDLIPAWKALAEIDESTADWTRLVADLLALVEFAPDDVSARLKAGKLLLLTGSANQALALANAGLDRDSRNADLHALKAAVALRLDDKAGAVREAKTALGLDPANADALTVLAVDQLASGNASRALSLIESAAGSKALDDNVGLQLLKLKLFEETGDFRSAEDTLKKLIEENPQEIDYHKLLVNFYVERHRIKDAETELRVLVAANPSNSAVVLDLVRFLVTVKQAPADARQELDDRIKVSGDTFPFQMALADLDFDEGNSAGSKQLLENLIGNASTKARLEIARIALARHYLRRQNFEPADKLVDDILHDDPHNVPALVIRATIDLQRSQPDAAVPILTAALSYQPRSLELMSLLATAYERSGLIELADKQLADATRASNFDPHVAAGYAGFLERHGSPARAEEVLVDSMKRQPKNAEVLSALAQLRLTRRNWSGAQEVAESMRQTGDAGTADQIVGAALIGQGNINEAITFLQKAYQATPRTPQLLNLLTSAFLKANKSDEALVFLKSVIAKNPGDANALVLLGSVQTAGGDTDLAIKSFSAAVIAQPKNSFGYLALADVHRRKKDYDGAIGIIRKGLQEQPDATALQLALASTLEQKGDYESAISQYESLLDNQPGNLIASNNLASLLLDHRTDPASLKRALSIVAILRNSQIPQFEDTLGWAKYREGDYDIAVSLCKEAAAVLPGQAAVRYHLGMSYAAINRKEKAAEELKAALELHPHDALAHDIRTVLRKLDQQSPEADKLD